MSLRPGLAAAVLAAVVAVLLTGGAAAANTPAAISVTVDRAQISTRLGGKFVFRSTITNNGATAASGLIAHLNVLSLRDGVYVDPEDWSSNRTQYLDTISAGGSTTTTWRMQAVNDGDFGVYIAVLPETGAAQPPTTAPTIHLAVEERKTLNSGGILPLALGVPAVLGLIILGLRVRRGR
jgi:hypothetical protein